MKKFLMSLGLAFVLLFTLAAAPANVVANAAEDCKHENAKIQYYLDGEKPETCLEEAIAKLVCPDCDKTIYQKVQGEHKIETEVINATCTNGQKVVEKCTYCDYIQYEQELSKALGHNWKESAKVAATCTTPAGVAKVCTRCGAKEDFVADAGSEPLGHSYGKAVNFDATCVAKGYKEETCTRCGDVKKTETTDIDPDAHEKELVETLVEATCTTDGVGKYACKYCKKELTYTNIPAGHKWDEIVTKEATCKNDGLITKVCKVCEKLETVVVKSDPEKHVYVELENEYVAPTCGTTGKKVQFCTECNKRLETILPIDSKAEHKFEEIVIDATCTKAQMVVVRCKICEYVESENETIDETTGKPTLALGHKAGAKVEFKATCEEGSGYTITCTRCNEVIESKTNDDAKGHDWKAIEVVKPTCSAEGYTVYECSACGKKEKNVNDDGIAIDPTNHVPELVKTIQTATCTVPGVGKYQCKYCDDKAAWYASIPATHTWNEGEVTTAPTCTKEGVKTFTCTVCGETKTEKVAKVAHKYVKDADASYAATCGKDGLTVEKCSVCGDVKNTTLTKRPAHKLVEKVLEATCLLPQRVGKQCSECQYEEDTYSLVDGGTKALGHNYEATYIAATCDEAAGYSKKCTRCGDATDYIAFEATEKGYQAALGHNVKTYTKAATCSATGETYTYCDRCDKQLTETTVLAKDPNNHKVELEKTLLEPTCTVAGVGKFACELCGKNTIYQSIAPDHKWDDGKVTTAATCAKEGSKTFTCTVCNATKTEKIKTIAHTYVKDENASYPATCGKDGLTVKKCSVCGNTTQTAETKRPDHVWTEHVIDADCLNPQRVGEQCDKCKAVKSTAVEVIGSTALGHDWEEIIVEATCLKGNGWYKKCSRCDEKTSTVYYEIGDEEYIAALGHNWEAKEEVATCVKTGKTWEACTGCPETRNEVVVAIDSTNHVNEKCTKELKAATCTEAGVGKYECSDCKKVYYQSIPAKHTWGAEEVLTAATCGKAGKAKHVCTVCGKADEYTIAATGKHEYETITVAATCTAKGSVTVKCKVCGEVKSKVEKSMISHKYTVEKILPATCTDYAYVTFACEYCGKADPDRKELVNDSKFADHDLIEVHEDATCEHAERMHVKCKNCKLDEYKDVENGTPRYEHDYKEIKITATCTTKAKTYEKCTLCGDERNVVEGDYDKDNHEWKLVSTLKEATCTTPGVGKYQCSNKDCKVNAIYKVIEAKHNWDVDKEQVNASGNIVYCTCKADNCGYVKILSLVGAYEGFQLSTNEFESLEAAEKAVKAIMDQVIAFTNVVAKVTAKVDGGKLELTITTSDDIKGYSNVWVEIDGEKVEAVSGKFTYTVAAPAEETVYEVRYCTEITGASATSKGKIASYTYTPAE